MANLIEVFEFKHDEVTFYRGYINIQSKITFASRIRKVRRLINFNQK